MTSLFSAAAPVAQASYNSTPAVGYAQPALVFGFGNVYDTTLQCPQRHYLTLGVLDPPGAYDCNRCKAHRPRGENHYQCRACDYDICVQCRPVYAHQQPGSAPLSPDFTLHEKLERLRTAIDGVKSQISNGQDNERHHSQQINKWMSAVVGLQRDVHRLSEELSAARSNPSVITEPPTAPPRPVVAA